MDALPLPPRPHLDQYKKRAKDLVKACRSPADGAVRAWATEWLEALARLHGVEITPFVRGSMTRTIDTLDKKVRARKTCALADAQFLLARAHGFESWARFAAHVEGLAMSGSEVQRFETAADAVVSGDLATLSEQLQEEPALSRARSIREHHATLLHYVAANGVEDFRQKSPANAPAVARLLLEAGAEVDARADTYGGGAIQTTMNLLVSSVHPHQARVQSALVEVLLDGGAAIDGLESDGSPLMTALAFGYAEAAETLAARGARVDNVLAAAGLGRDDLVAGYVGEDGRLKAGVPLVSPGWFHLANDPQAHLRLAFVWACAFGHVRVVEVLLGRGVDPGSTDQNGQTGLHLAAAYGRTEVVERLLAQGAPLETKNQWGGTVLGSTAYFAVHASVEGVDYPALLERLISAGADVSAARFPTGQAALDDVLRRHRTG